MKKKFNLYCGLLIAAIVFSIGVEMFQTCFHMVQGGQAGWEAARKEQMMGKRKDPMETVRMMYKMAPVEMLPKAETYANFSTGDSIVNLKTGEKMPIMITGGLVVPENGSNRMGVMQAVSYVSFAFLIVFMVAFIKLVLSVNKGHIFEQSMETQLAWGGWAVLAMYILQWIGALYNYVMNVYEFDFETYNIELVQMPNFALLYSAFGMLLMGQIFKIGRQMREEQELTI